jgi:hypothetical protein
MDVIGFLCVSLGSSTVQLHYSLGSRCACVCSEAGFSSQNGNGAEEFTTEDQHTGVRFLWTKGLNAKDIHKEMFPVYGRMCLLCKAVQNWVENVANFLLMTKVEMEEQKWLRQQSKDFYATSFDALIKRWDKCINVSGGYVEKCFFQVQTSRFTFYIHL